MHFFRIAFPWISYSSVFDFTWFYCVLVIHISPVFIIVSVLLLFFTICYSVLILCLCNLFFSLCNFEKCYINKVIIIIIIMSSLHLGSPVFYRCSNMKTWKYDWKRMRKRKTGAKSVCLCVGSQYTQTHTHTHTHLDSLKWYLYFFPVCLIFVWKVLIFILSMTM